MLELSFCGPQPIIFLLILFNFWKIFHGIVCFYWSWLTDSLPCSKQTLFYEVFSMSFISEIFMLLILWNVSAYILSSSGHFFFKSHITIKFDLWFFASVLWAMTSIKHIFESRGLSTFFSMILYPENLTCINHLNSLPCLLVNSANWEHHQNIGRVEKNKMMVCFPLVYFLQLCCGMIDFLA